MAINYPEHIEMGAANSHRRLSKPITGKMGKRKSIPDEKGKYQDKICGNICLIIAASGSHGYIILTLKEEKIVVANADSTILNLLNTIIKRHVHVIREGWLREVSSQNVNSQ